MAEAKPPVIFEPWGPDEGKPATMIYLHGYGDDAMGQPNALAQQFYQYKKMPYLRWLLPNAPKHPLAYTEAWFLPKAFTDGSKPRVPGEVEEDETAEDDVEGILTSVAKVDALVKAEIERGVEPHRILVGGFSQGCVVSIAFGLLGEMGDKVGGVFPMCGYFPFPGKIEALKNSKGLSLDKESNKQWYYVHGGTDRLVPRRMYELGKEELYKWVEKNKVYDHLYEGVGHTIDPRMLRDILRVMTHVIPPFDTDEEEEENERRKKTQTEAEVVKQAEVQS